MLSLTNTINNRLSPAQMILNNALGQQLTRAIDQVVGKIDALVGGSLDVASKFEQLQQVAYNLAAQNGSTAESVDQNVNSIRKYGIEAGVAANLVINFSRYNLDLAKSTQLARVAQDQAQVSGSNSSETLQRLLYGIQTYNTEIFRTAGLNINMQQAFDKYAKSLNKSSEQLTNTERSQATLNAVLEEGKKSAGSYEASLGTASKVWGSYERVVNDLQLTLGTPFLKASMMAGQAITDFTKRITDAFNTGGRLAPMLESTGAAFGAFFDIVKGGAGEAANTLINFFSGPMFSGIASLIGQAAQWGFNLISSFAIGIAEGTGTVLALSMQGIGDLISYFLEAHSPPNLLPDIDKWGASTMTAYLDGMTQADFGVFTSLGGTIKSALAAMGGDAASQDAMWKNLAGSMTKALSGGGGDDFIKQLQAQLGQYGGEVGKLAGLQLQLADATEKVNAAEEALEKSREAEKEAGQNITDMVNEYNKLAQTEKDPAKLAAKRAEFKAAKDAYKNSVDKRKEDEKNLEVAKKNADALEKQVKLQQDLVSALIEMTKAYKGAGAGEGEGGKNNPSAPFEKAGGAVTSLQNKIDEFKQRLLTIFQPVADSFNTHVVPVFKEFEKQLYRVLDLLVEMGILTKTTTPGAKKKGGFQDEGLPEGGQTTYGMTEMGKALNENVIAAGKWVAILWLASKPIGFILNVGTKISAVFQTIGGATGAGALLTRLGAIGVIISGIIFSVKAWSENWQGIRDTASRIGDVIGEIFRNPGKYDLGKIFGESIGEKFDEIFGRPIRAAFKQIGIDAENIDLVKTLVVVWYKINEVTGKAWDAIKKVITDAWEKIRTALVSAWNKVVANLVSVWEKIKSKAVDYFTGPNSIYAKVTKAWKDIATEVDKKWAEIKSALISAWNSISNSAETILGGVKDAIGSIWTGIKTTAETIWGNVKTSLETIWGGIKTAAETVWGGIKTAVITAWDGVETAASTVWGAVKTALETAWNAVKGSAETIWNGITSTITGIWDTFQSWVDSPNNPVQSIRDTIQNSWNAIKLFATNIWNGPDGIITKISGWWDSFSGKAIEIGNAIASPFKTAFDNISSWVGDVIKALEKLWGWIWGNNSKNIVNLPDALEWARSAGGGGSGTGIVANQQRISPPASAQSMMMQTYSNINTNQYNLTLQTRMQAENVRQGFQTMQILGA
jgi:phage-related protein